MNMHLNPICIVLSLDGPYLFLAEEIPSLEQPSKPTNQAFAKKTVTGFFSNACGKGSQIPSNYGRTHSPKWVHPSTTSSWNPGVAWRPWCWSHPGLASSWGPGRWTSRCGGWQHCQHRIWDAKRTGRRSGATDASPGGSDVSAGQCVKVLRAGPSRPQRFGLGLGRSRCMALQCWFLSHFPLGNPLTGQFVGNIDT